MNASFSLLRTSLILALLAAPLAAVAQVTSAALAFEGELGTENAIVTNSFVMNGGDTASGVAVGGAATIENAATLNSDSDYTDDAYSLRVYGQLTLSNGSDKSLYGGALFVQNGTTNVGLKDFALNGGQQRAITFGSSGNSMPQITENGNGGPPAPTKFISAPDNYFTSRNSALTTASTTFANATALTPTDSGGTLTFNAASTGITVFNWDVAKLGSVNAVAINAAAGSDVIINVFDVPGNTWSPSFNFNGASDTVATRTLWNIEGDVSVTTDREWYGSILGVGTSLTDDNQDIDGQIFTENLTVNSGELHYEPFAAIPEPVDYAALAGCAALMAAFARRRWMLSSGN